MAYAEGWWVGLQGQRFCAESRCRGRRFPGRDEGGRGARRLLRWRQTGRLPSVMAQSREALLLAIRERNASYRTCRSVTEENQDLAQEVDRLREQLHRLEGEAVARVLAPAGDVQRSTGDALRNDALKLSPSLWPRLACGALQRLSPSDSADFCSAVEAVCATARDGLAPDPAAGHGAGAEGHAMNSDGGPGDRAPESVPSSGGGPGPAAPTKPAGLAASLTLEEVVSKFATHIVQDMLAADGIVDLGRLRAHEESFRQLLLDVCWHGAASALTVSKELAEQDRKRGASLPANTRTLMSEQLVDTHDKLAQAQQAVFASQAELLEAYGKLAASGKETAALRRQLVTVQGDLFKAHKELDEEVTFFRQVQEENRVQAAIIKSHGPHLQQLAAEIGALKDEREALHRKVCDLENLVLAMHEGQIAQARSLVSLSSLACTLSHRFTRAMDKRRQETCSLESLLSLALAVQPQSPGDAGTDGYGSLMLADECTPADCGGQGHVQSKAEGGVELGSRRAGLALNAAGIESWAREALEEAASDLRRIVQDVENEYECDGKELSAEAEALETHLLHHMATLQQMQGKHSAAAATLARVLADRHERDQRLSAVEAEAQDAARAAALLQATPAPLQRRSKRSASLGADASSPAHHTSPSDARDVKASPLAGVKRSGSFGSPGRADSPSSAGGIGMSFSTGPDGCFYMYAPLRVFAQCAVLQRASLGREEDS